MICVGRTPGGRIVGEKTRCFWQVRVEPLSVPGHLRLERTNSLLTKGFLLRVLHVRSSLTIVLLVMDRRCGHDPMQQMRKLRHRQRSRSPRSGSPAHLCFAGWDLNVDRHFHGDFRGSWFAEWWSLCLCCSHSFNHSLRTLGAVPLQAERGLPVCFLDLCCPVQQLPATSLMWLRST